MYPIIEQLFKKIGVKNITELDKDEQITYDQIIRELKERTKPINPEDWEEFLEEQLEKTIESFNPNDSEKKKDFLWTQMYLIQKFLVYLKGPKREEKKIKKEYNI